MLKKLFIFILLVILFSCTDSKDSNKSEKNNKGIKEKGIWRDKFKISKDTTLVKFYDAEGLLEIEGKLLNDSLKIGIWSYYKNGILNNKKEYINVENSEFLNQFWIFDRDQTILGGSFYEIMNINKEYNLGDTIFVEVSTPYKYYSDLDSELLLVYSTEEKFDENYSNRNKIAFDTIWNAKKSYPSHFEDDDSKFYITFAIKANKIGTSNLSGILIETAKDVKDNDSIIRYREMFLDIEFNVKDTVN